MTGSRGERVGLLVVDVQNGFCHPDGARARLLGQAANQAAWAIVPRVLDVVTQARQHGVPVWFTRMVDRPHDASRSRRQLSTGIERRGGRIDLCPEGSWDAELVEVIAAEVRSSDEVVVKHRASAFYNTPLEAELRMLDVGLLVVVGTTTSFCVDSTVRDAAARDLEVVVIADCVADTRADDHAAVLAAIGRWHGAVVDSWQDGLFSELLEAAGLGSPSVRP